MGVHYIIGVEHLTHTTGLSRLRLHQHKQTTPAYTFDLKRRVSFRHVPQQQRASQAAH
jgi:hypothetical protein